MIVDGKRDTPSSPNTSAGRPVATSISVTRAPAIGAPSPVSKTIPNGSIKISIVAAANVRPSTARTPLSVKLSPERTESTQSPRTGTGGLADVRTTPIKMPLFTSLSHSVSRSESPLGVCNMTIIRSIAFGSILSAGDDIETTMGAPARILLLRTRLAGLSETPANAPSGVIGMLLPLLVWHSVERTAIFCAPGADVNSYVRRVGVGSRGRSTWMSTRFD